MAKNTQEPKNRKIENMLKLLQEPEIEKMLSTVYFRIYKSILFNGYLFLLTKEIK